MIRFSNLRQVALGAALLTSATSCDVLNQDPPAALTPEEGYATPDRIAKSAVGMYDALQNLEFLGGRALIYSDIRSDDTNPATFFGNMSTFNATPNDATVTAAWTGGYRTLYSVNYFLQQLQANVANTTPELATQYSGEGKFIRALVYFHLVNMFGQPYRFTPDASHLGVPIQLTAPDAVTAFDPAQRLPRSTVREVYTQMEQDLTEAIRDLPETYTTAYSRTARATKDAARTLLSRVYLYEGRYDQAATLAGQVISGGRHTLNASPATPFISTSYQTTESIFSVGMNSGDNPNTNNALGQHYGRLRRADIIVTPYARIDTNQFRTKDLRRTALLDPVATVTNVFSLKYNNGPFDYVPIARYSEVILNRAEGLAQTNAGISADAVTLLNQVRNRAKPAYAPAYTVASFASKQALIDAILFERRLELAFEGHRYYDLLRYGRNSSRVNYGSERVVLPIPFIDIQQNPNLVQNPGY